MSQKIERDHQRFRKIVRGKVKSNLGKYISRGEMIGRKGKDLVSIPLPSIELPQFRFGRSRQHKDESADDFKVRQSKEEAEAREAVMTFILGLTAENIAGKYIAKPAGDRMAEVKGRQVLDKYNCAGCHQIRPGMYEFKANNRSRWLLEEQCMPNEAELKKDYSFPNHNAWVGTPSPFPDRLIAYGTEMGAPTELRPIEDPEFKSLDPGGPLTVAALKGGTVQAADLFTTDPTISANNFVVLDDPKSNFAAAGNRSGNSS